MPPILDRARPRPAWPATLTLLTLLTLTGCGGGGDDGSPGGPVGVPPASGVPALVGDWVMLQCTPLGASSSARTLVRVTQTGSSSFEWGSGLVQFPSANCTGAATAMPVTKIATVQVNDIQAVVGIAAHWSTATLVSGTVSHGVWAKTSSTGLCIVGDQRPSLFASAAAVLDAINVAPNGMCYTPLHQT